jgi:hypothetical protein
MAFAYTQRVNDFMGRGIVMGNFTDDAGGGTIYTGFNNIKHVDLTSNIKIRKPTYSKSGGNITIVCTSGDAGTYMIYGE